MKKSKPLPSLTQLKNWATKKIKQGTTPLNNTFNNLSLKNRRIMVIAFGMTTGFVCVALIVHTVLTPLSLPLPFDKSQPLPTAPAPNMSDSLHLIPLGTLTGEMDGHQIALTVATLEQMVFFVRDDVNHPTNADSTKNTWQSINAHQLKDLSQYLQFTPTQNQNISIHTPKQ